jgi:hypothetical protein
VLWRYAGGSNLDIILWCVLELLLSGPGDPLCTQMTSTMTADGYRSLSFKFPPSSLESPYILISPTLIRLKDQYELETLYIPQAVIQIPLSTHPTQGLL